MPVPCAGPCAIAGPAHRTRGPDAVEDDGGDLVDEGPEAAALRVEPFHGPVQCADQVQPHHRQVGVAAQLTAEHGLLQQRIPVVGIGAAHDAVAVLGRQRNLPVQPDVGRGEVPMLQQPVQMPFDGGDHPLPVGGVGRQRLDTAVDLDADDVDAAVQHQAQDLVLGPEVVVDAAGLDASGLGDLPQRRGRKAVVAEEPRGFDQDQVARGVARGHLGHGGCCCRQADLARGHAAVSQRRGLARAMAATAQSNLRKSGLRFSRKACTPSFDSGVL
jgi:hypothetical protein